MIQNHMARMSLLKSINNHPGEYIQYYTTHYNLYLAGFNQKIIQQIQILILSINITLKQLNSLLKYPSMKILVSSQFSSLDSWFPDLNPSIVKIGRQRYFRLG